MKSRSFKPCVWRGDYQGRICLASNLALAVIGILPLLISMQAVSASPDLFSDVTPRSEWTGFHADGYEAAVSGVVFSTTHTPCCGVPLGGISTGCLDIDPEGTLGFCTLFSRYPRKLKLFQPFLGVAMEGKTWLLASPRIVAGGPMQGCIEHGRDPYYPEYQNNTSFWTTTLPEFEGVQSASEVLYWGHYPMADLEFKTGAPISVGLRCWAPFLPGNPAASNTPAAVFEVRLRNPSKDQKKGTLAFSFPAPLGDAKRPDYHKKETFTPPPPVFSRKKLQGPLNGTLVSMGEFRYALGVMGEEKTYHAGSSLAQDPTAWGKIAQGLPEPAQMESGSSVSVDFDLQPGEEKRVRFLLAWWVPTWGETGTKYYQMYAARYRDLEDVIARMLRDHESLLARILAWQQVIYSDQRYPNYLKDALVNSLSMITETGYWGQSKDPLDDWCHPDGLFGMIECPRACPQIECIPCSWYGNMPIVYFFPELARTSLRGYKRYQRQSDGAAPFIFGAQDNLWQGVNNAWENQIMLNGVCYVDMVDRLWQRTSDPTILNEFWDSVKASTTLTATMGEDPYPVVGFPPGDAQTEWWEGWPWTGIATHAAGMHLSNLKIAERMAEAVGDTEFVGEARAWLEQGSRDLETLNWEEGSYLLFHKPQSGEKSNKVMSNQLDAEWANAYHGLKGVFQSDRVAQTLDTIRKTCLSEKVGAVSFAAREGEQELTSYGIFPPETLILGMTYLYNGQRETGMQMIQQCLENMVLRHGKGWDMCNQLRADTGEPTFGTDYYQMMIIWALPAAIDGQDIKSACGKGGLVDRILTAANK
jgi:uncharacterized protein (DUF608 family)